MMNHAQKRDVIINSELFSNLEQRIIEKVAAIAMLRQYDKDDIVFHEGDPVSGFYFVVSGRLKANKISYEAREHIIKILGQGSVCAEAAICAGDDYPISLQALEPASLLLVPKNEFIMLLRQEAELALGFITMLSRRLGYMVQKLEDVSLKEVVSRISRYLIETAVKQYGSIEPGIKIEIGIAKTELAAALGTIPETLSRNLKKMEQHSIITNARTRIVLHDIDRLYRLINGEKL